MWIDRVNESHVTHYCAIHALGRSLYATCGTEYTVENRFGRSGRLEITYAEVCRNACLPRVRKVQARDRASFLRN